ncbi:NAD-dependent epimerase/dehydratase family protein [Alkaliphilus crotonatoxidans]
MKKRILITGANGFIGQSLIEELNPAEYEIYALGLGQEYQGSLSKIKEYYAQDITIPFQLSLKVDAIIHLAALNQTNINSDFAYEAFKSINVEGTENVINSCYFERFILFSTANLYERQGGYITEASPLAPKSFYERSKKEAEELCQMKIAREKLLILRPVNITGVKQENKAIIPYFFSRAVKGEPIEVFVPQNRRIQLLSIKDLSRVLKVILKGPLVSGVLNLANDDSMEIRTVAKNIIDLCSSPSNLICSNLHEEVFSEIRSDQAKELLGWEAKDTIEKIIMDYAKHILS